MDKSISKNRVSAVRSYLKELGHPITQVQGYEVVARANGFENKHTFAASLDVSETQPVAPVQTVVNTIQPVVMNTAIDRVQVINGRTYILDARGALHRYMRPGDTPMSVLEMKQEGWKIGVVLPVPLSDIGYINHMNDYVSKMVTGLDYALHDISYRVFPHYYNEEYVAVMAIGYIENPDDIFGDQLAELKAASATPYGLMPKEDLTKLAELLETATDHETEFFTTLYENVPHKHRVVWNGGEDFNVFEVLNHLHEIIAADRSGTPYKLDGDEITFDDALGVMVFEHIDTLTQHFEDDGHFLHVSDIAYGKRVGDLAWEFTIPSTGEKWRLGFDFEQTKLPA